MIQFEGQFSSKGNLIRLKPPFGLISDVA